MARARLDCADDAITELAALLAFQNLSSSFNAALGLVPKGFCPLSHHVKP
jgi:hypothetical protein